MSKEKQKLAVVVYKDDNDKIKSIKGKLLSDINSPFITLESGKKRFHIQSSRVIKIKEEVDEV